MHDSHLFLPFLLPLLLLLLLLLLWLDSVPPVLDLLPAPVPVHHLLLELGSYPLDVLLRLWIVVARGVSQLPHDLVVVLPVVLLHDAAVVVEQDVIE